MHPRQFTYPTVTPVARPGGGPKPLPAGPLPQRPGGQAR